MDNAEEAHYESDKGIAAQAIYNDATTSSTARKLFYYFFLKIVISQPSLKPMLGDTKLANKYFHTAKGRKSKLESFCSKSTSVQRHWTGSPHMLNHMQDSSPNSRLDIPIFPNEDSNPSVLFQLKV